MAGLDLLKNVVGNTRQVFPNWKPNDPSSNPPANFLAANVTEAALDTALLTISGAYTAKSLSVMSRNDKSFALRQAYEKGTWPAE